MWLKSDERFSVEHVDRRLVLDAQQKSGHRFGLNARKQNKASARESTGDKFMVAVIAQKQLAELLGITQRKSNCLSQKW